MRKLMVQFLTAILICCGLFSVDAEANLPLYAGGGQYNPGSPDTIDLNVAFAFDISPEFNPNKDWENTLTESSKLLYNATDGQVQLGKINLYNNCPFIADKADIFIRSGSGRASAPLGALRTPSKYITLFHDTDSQNTQANRGHVTVVHELGHYVFFLLDEYKNLNGNEYFDADGRPIACIPGSNIVSLMDAGGTYKNQKTEFLLQKDIEACSSTKQYQKTEKAAGEPWSDWKLIETYAEKKLHSEITVPITYSTTMPPGHNGLAFTYFDCAVRGVVTLDRSGSMEGDALVTAQQGGRLFINLASTDNNLSLSSNYVDYIGVASFSDDPIINYPITAITPTTRTEAKAAITAIEASGQTNIGGGLQIALNMIEGEGTPLSNEVIVLLSDGQHNTGTDPNSVLPDINNRNAIVYTVGLGDSVDAGLLSNIANQTGGSYFFATDAYELQPHFVTIYNKLHANAEITELASNSSTMVQLATAQSITRAIEIDSYTKDGGEVTFVLSWDSGELDLTLVRPQQSKVLDDDSDVVLHIKESGSEIYRIANPAIGTWIAEITPTPENTRYNLQVFSGAKAGVQVNATTEKGVYYLGERILLDASVSAPPSGADWSGGVSHVAGAEVEGTVYLDGVEQARLTLYDDGSAEHGDVEADDGSYRNYFEPTQPGSYTFDVKVTNRAGFLPPGEMLGMESEEFLARCQNCTARPVAPFTRNDELTVVVEPTALPDLVVQNIVVTGNDIEVIIKNQGRGPVLADNDFWVDLYINPETPPTAANDTWEFTGDSGLVWGIIAPLKFALGEIVMEPGETISLSIDNFYYWSSLSKFSGAIPPGTPIYAQVDSANADDDNGGVLEDHEANGGTYNNIFGPVISGSGTPSAVTQSESLYLPMIPREGELTTSAAKTTDNIPAAQTLPSRPK